VLHLVGQLLIQISDAGNRKHKIEQYRVYIINLMFGLAPQLLNQKLQLSAHKQVARLKYVMETTCV